MLTQPRSRGWVRLKLSRISEAQVLFALTATFVALFGAGPDATAPGALTAGLLSVAALVAMAALLARLALALPGTDSTVASVRSRALRRRAARLGVVVVRDPDAPGRSRPRAPGRVVVPA